MSSRSKPLPTPARPDGTSLLKFRFLQGAPDRGHQFRRAGKMYAAGLKPQTITGWHGSPIFNWHNIFEGRASFPIRCTWSFFGEWVYLSQDFKCSLN